MVWKFCSRSHGQPDPGVRSAAMISISRTMSREGFMTRSYPPLVPAKAGTQFLMCLDARLRGHERERSRSVAGRIRLARRLEQEPGPLLGLVDINFEQARAGGVLVLFSELVRLAHRGSHRLIIGHQLAQLLCRPVELFVVFLHCLS